MTAPCDPTTSWQAPPGELHHAVVITVSEGRQVVAVCQELAEAQHIAGWIAQILTAEFSFDIEVLTALPYPGGHAIQGDPDPSRLHLHAQEGPYSPAHVVGNTAGLIGLLMATIAALRERSGPLRPSKRCASSHTGDGAEFDVVVGRDDHEPRWPDRATPYTNTWAREERAQVVLPWQ